MKKIKLKVFRCLRCGHKWSPRKARIPICCGKCKSPYWGSKKAGK